MKSPLVAFTGLAGSGKSTAAAALVERLGFVRLSFADPLRDMLAALGVTREQMSAGKLEPIDWLAGRTPRYLLQTLGTEWGRERVDPEIWVMIARRRIEASLASGKCVVLDDCRFNNEARMIRQLGGIVVHVHRPGVTAMMHASENGVDSEHVTHVIRNGYPTAHGLADFIHRITSMHLEDVSRQPA